MRTFFFLTNLIGGILVLLLGLAVILIQTHNPAALVVGIIAVALAAICIWLAKECVSAHPHPTA
ncbi:MAG: hypothetical protein Q7J42_18505 [Sulfuritalea sp.]|nr:hypothetical protein [Sulfuritalea sp.]